ncbi:MAG: hypothetical protein AB7I79_04925 [Rhizobiaceae bacterium]
MNRFLAYLMRFLAIILGYAAASLAASAFIHVFYLGSLGFGTEEGPWVVIGSLVFSIPFTALFVAYFAFVPAIVAIFVAEMFSMRGWAFHAIAGGVVGAVVVALFRRASSAEGDVAAGDPRFALLIVGAGVVAGLVYRLVAGGRAGAWLPPRAPISPER